MRVTAITRGRGITGEMKRVFGMEIETLRGVAAVLGPEFGRAVLAIADSSGQVVVTGIGKSGIIAGGIAAAFRSAGTAAVYVHAGEALHGDMGIISSSDVVLAVSKSGESGELNTLLPMVKKLGAKVIAVTAEPGSKMAGLADIVLELKIEREACPLQLAPTSSTTASLVLGEAIAIAVQAWKRGRIPEEV